MATTHLVPDQVSMNDGGGVPRGVLLLSVLQCTKVKNNDFFSGEFKKELKNLMTAIAWKFKNISKF